MFRLSARPLLFIVFTVGVACQGLLILLGGLGVSRAGLVGWSRRFAGLRLGSRAEIVWLVTLVGRVAVIFLLVAFVPGRLPLS